MASVLDAVAKLLTKEQLDDYSDLMLAILAVLSLDELYVLDAPIAIGEMVLNPKK